MTSLFIGNISRNVKPQDLEDELNKFGKCRVNFKVRYELLDNIQGSYAFVEFDDDKEAEEALDGLQDKEMGGLKITLEWSKKSGKFDQKGSSRPPRFKQANYFQERSFRC